MHKIYTNRQKKANLFFNSLYYKELFMSRIASNTRKKVDYVYFVLHFTENYHKNVIYTRYLYLFVCTVMHKLMHKF